MLAQPINRTLHFLLVEDDDAHARIIRSAFSAGEPCTLHRVASGPEALAYLSRGDPRTDIILLDLRLHGLDGFDILQSLKADPRFKNIPVVILTTSNSTLDHRTAHTKGADSYIVKPAHFGELCNVVSELKRYWHRRRKLGELQPSGVPAVR